VSPNPKTAAPPPVLWVRLVRPLLFQVVKPILNASSNALSAAAPLADKLAAAELLLVAGVEELLSFLHAVIKITVEIRTVAIEKRFFRLVFMVLFLLFCNIFHSEWILTSKFK
jgi:hypothetical protein